jgi:hypothetical protein
MFEFVAVPAAGVDGCVLDDGLPPDDGAWEFDVFDEAAWEALLADAPPVEVPADPGWGFADCAPSGWSALDLDVGTGDAGVLSDAALIEAIVGFDRVGSWASARQARLLAELAARRPADPVPDADGVSVGSRFVPDEVGVALKLARGLGSDDPRTMDARRADLLAELLKGGWSRTWTPSTTTPTATPWTAIPPVRSRSGCGCGRSRRASRWSRWLLRTPP